MNDEQYSELAQNWYRKAEEKAAQYFQILLSQVKEQSYVTVLTEDIKQWRRNHVHPLTRLSNLLPWSKRGQNSMDYYKYLEWLNYTGKLDEYLDRSMSYIYLRDLGKDLSSPETRRRIQRMVQDIRQHLITSKRKGGGGQPDFMNMAGLYRWSQKEGVQSATIWLMDKLKAVAAHIPEEMDADQAQRKLLKIIIGVIMHVIDDMEGAELTPSVRSDRLDAAIRLGYSYGLTYPFIDDLLDSQVLTAIEKEQYTRFIRTAILSGSVPELTDWCGDHKELITFVHTELTEAFQYIRDYQKPEALQTFFEQSYVFFHSQDQDRSKDLTNAHYTNEELYIPVILKSSSSRLIVRSVLSAEVDYGFEERTFCYGIYNQLADDFADMFDDLKDGAVTPYTYYLRYHEERDDLINPYELYWTVILYLIHHVYHHDMKTCDVILNRAINGLKRCKARLGEEQYNKVMQTFASGQPQFNRLIQQMVRGADNVDFFDKLLRDQLLTVLRNERKEKEEFQSTIETMQHQINSYLPITEYKKIPCMDEPLIDAANYSLQGDGKRIRPILAWMMGVKEYGLDPDSIVPLLRSLEYMHTASLIFDDLPSQDNAPTRRGRPTLHKVHNSATAELTGLYLIQKAIEEQSTLDRFPPKTVVDLVNYSSQRAAELCRGQAMDLHSKGKNLTLEQLNTMCFYKTGIAFEASLVMPAILAEINKSEIEVLKKYAYHAGVAFQIKDDLLDWEGNLELLGKPVKQDIENNNSTFVTVLGMDGARKEMWDHYCSALRVLHELPRSPAFLKHLLDYIVNRNY